MLSFSFIQPDDFHLHIRDDVLMHAVLPASAESVGRAVIMPNLTPPITDIAMALAYKARILAALPATTAFQPLMTLYLTEHLSLSTLQEVAITPDILGIKLYPAGATTNSDAGIQALESIYPLLETMEELGIPLLIHGEIPHFDVDMFDREPAFITQQLEPLTRRFPLLRVTLEHITTQDAVQFIESAPAHVGATITPHHLLYNRNHMLAGGVKPHYYCLPILKRERHREALVKAATSGNPKFFAGTDSAPHLQSKKESACGCAGIYNAPYAIALYAEIFDQALDLSLPASQKRFESFMSRHGAQFYGLPLNPTQITLTQTPVAVPIHIDTPLGPLIPIRAGEMVGWKVEKIEER